MITISPDTPGGTTPEMLEVRLSMLTSQFESEGGKVREDTLTTLVRDLHIVEGVTEEFQQRLSDIVPDLRRSILMDKLVFMEKNPSSFLYNFGYLLEEIPHLSALSELGKKELDERVRGAEMKSKTSKNDLLGDSCQD